MSTLQRWWAAFNQLPVFDLNRYPFREFLSRWGGSAINLVVVLQRLVELRNFPGFISDVDFARPFYAHFDFIPTSIIPAAFDLENYYLGFGYSLAQIRTLWWLRFVESLLETGTFVGYIAAFLTRRPARIVARGVMETAFPMLWAQVPGFITMTPYTYHLWIPRQSTAHLAGLCVIMPILIFSLVVNVLALRTLRPAFTIVSEARAFIRGGFYARVRHPIYASHLLMFFCWLLLHFNASAVVIYAIWAAGVVVRARIEERKLVAAFPEYAEYQRTTGMFFPRR